MREGGDRARVSGDGLLRGEDRGCLGEGAVVVVVLMIDEGCFGCTNPCLAGLTRRSMGGVSEIVAGVAV